MLGERADAQPARLGPDDEPGQGAEGALPDLATHVTPGGVPSIAPAEGEGTVETASGAEPAPAKKAAAKKAPAKKAAADVPADDAAEAPAEKAAAKKAPAKKAAADTTDSEEKA